MDAAEAVNTYGAAWNEADEDKRRALLDRSWSDDGRYMDPTAQADGRDALLAHISGFRAMMPGHTIDMTSDVDVHNNVFRFAWIMRNGNETVLEGMDFGELADDGRIDRIVGFFGPFPAISS
jgi:hypothetical protein